MQIELVLFALQKTFNLILHGHSTLVFVMQPMVLYIQKQLLDTRLFCSKYKLLYITKMLVQAYVDLSKLKQIKVHRVYVISIKLKLVRVGITYV